jgi:nucleotide-binding universal stress UspA family protein
MPKTMLDRVLVPLDGSDRAESILPLLESLLRASGAELFFVRAISPVPSFNVLVLPFDEADGYLRGIADRFQQNGFCAHTLVSAGKPQEVIESVAADEEITLIVMSLHTDAAAGPVLGRMLRESPRPLLALRPAREGEAGIRRFQPHPGILVPLDGSETSRRSLPLAWELADALEARVILLRVEERPSDRREAPRELRDLGEQLKGQGGAAELRIECGEPVEQILRVCRDPAIGLVAMTTQGRSGMSEGRLGGVTRELLSRCPVPVLALHVRE